MGLFTKTKPPQVTVLTAAAHPVQLDDEKSMKRTLAKHETWEDEAWAYFDEVPEIKFGVNFSGNALTKVMFFAATHDLEGNVVPVNSETSPLFGTPVAIQADAEMARLKAEMGGQGELNRLAEICLEVPGQFYLFGKGARVDPDTGLMTDNEVWDIVSVDCVEATTERDEQERPIVYVKDDPQQKREDAHRVDPDLDTLIHAYIRHPRYRNRADSYMRALLTDCQTLVALNNQVLAESRSRMNAGLLLVPREVSFEQSTDPKNPSVFVRDLIEAMVTPIEDPTDTRSLVPTVIRGTKEDLGPDGLRVLSLSRDTGEQVDKRILARIDRIARGLNVPVEVVMGHMATTFSNAEQIDADTFDDHLEPKCRTLAEIYGYAFLRPQLVEAMNTIEARVMIDELLAETNGETPTDSNARGITLEEINEVFVWFDASALVRTRDPDDAPEQAVALGAMSLGAYRKRRNITELEAPQPDELALQVALSRGTFDPALTAALLAQGGLVVPPQFLQPTIVDVPGPGGAQGLVASNGAVSEGPQPVPFDGSDLGRALLAIDADLRARIHGAAEAAMERALERAGGRLKSRRQVAQVVASNTPLPLVAAQLGPALVATAGYDVKSLLDGAWTILERQFKEWCTAASDEARRVIEAATKPFTDAQVEQHRLMVQQSVDTGWRYFATELDVIAATRLYDPEGDGDITIYGRIPIGVVREALSIAGGDDGVFTAIVAAAEPSKPVGGIATGKLLMDMGESVGAMVEGYMWVYGPAHREHEFNPHVELDGVTFQAFTDEKLINHEGWPETSHFYPGDHVGCSCDILPVMIIAPGHGTHADVDALAAEFKETKRAINKAEYPYQAQDAVRALRSAIADRTGHVIDIRGIDDLSKRQASELVKALEGAITDHPDLVRLLKEVNIGLPINQHATAEFVPASGIITFRQRSLGSLSRWVKNEHAQGWWASRKSGDILTHELTHAASRRLTADQAIRLFDEVSRKAVAAGFPDPADWFTSRDMVARQWIEKRISGYAITKQNEFFAELMNAVHYDEELAAVFGETLQNSLITPALGNL